jgi:hypothetical protein
MRQKSIIGFCLFKPPVLAAAFAGLVASLAVFAGAEKSNELRDASLASGKLHLSIVTARTFMRVTPDGAMPDYKVEPKAASVATRSSKNGAVRPSGNTLWIVDDQDAIADGVTIDAKNVWTAWTLTGARLSIYPINGNGTRHGISPLLIAATRVWLLPRRQIDLALWSRTQQATIFDNTPLLLAATARRIGLSIPCE